MNGASVSLICRLQVLHLSRHKFFLHYIAPHSWGRFAHDLFTVALRPNPTSQCRLVDLHTATDEGKRSLWDGNSVYFASGSLHVSIEGTLQILLGESWRRPWAGDSPVGDTGVAPGPSYMCQYISRSVKCCSCLRQTLTCKSAWRL